MIQKINGLIIFIAFFSVLLFSWPLFALQFDTRPISPIPAQSIPTKTEAQKIALGQQLFNDKNLSHNKTRSCASCHALQTGGSARPKNGINIPSIFNVQYNFKQFWNGRADTLEEAITLQLNDPNIMGFDIKKDINTLLKNKHYPKKITQPIIINALTAYIKTLNTPNSRFDQYLRGNQNILTTAEKNGFNLFKTYGCVSCHQGVLIGGNTMQKMGIYHDYRLSKPILHPFDLGYYQVTKNPNDQFVFKVPSLRNVAIRAPYLHDGSIQSLNDVVEKMAFYQIGRPISHTDIEYIVQFLNTLTGQIPKK